MDRESVRKEFQKIVEVIKKTSLGAADLEDGCFLGGDLGMDSIEILEAMVDIQKTFSITIPKEQLGDLYTVKDVLDLIQRNGPQA